MLINNAKDSSIEKQLCIKDFDVMIDDDGEIYYISRNRKNTDEIIVTELGCGASFVIDKYSTIEYFEFEIKAEIVKVYEDDDSYLLTFEDV